MAALLINKHGQKSVELIQVGLKTLTTKRSKNENGRSCS